MEASLNALGADYIDVYQVHWPDPATPIRETASGLAKLVREGLIRHVGVSNYSPAQIEEFSAVVRVETVQPPYHLFRRDIEADLLPYAAAHDIGMLVYGPLAHGLLGGSITDATTFGPGDWRAIVPPSPAKGSPATSRYLPNCAPSRLAAGPRSPNSQWPGCWLTRPSRSPSSARVPRPTSPKASAPSTSLSARRTWPRSTTS